MSGSLALSTKGDTLLILVSALDGVFTKLGSRQIQLKVAVSVFCLCVHHAGPGNTKKYVCFMYITFECETNVPIKNYLY